MKVAVFGLGYVGTVTAACLASNGHEVWGVDPEDRKVKAINKGRSPVVEPGLADLVAGAVAGGTLHATTSPADALASADLSLVCVGTPSSPHGSTDLSSVLHAVREIGEAVATVPRASSGFHSVVVRSTVPPGTVAASVVPVLEAAIGQEHGTVFGVGMCPEFLREGSGLKDFFDPPFTVLGTGEPRVAEAIGRLFSFIDSPLRVVDLSTAEALKYACNAFHATKVSFTNELSRLFRNMGVDSRTVMDLFCEDDRLNISSSYLRPGFAFGGSCLPKDLRSLLHLGRVNNVDMPLLSGTLASNELTVREAVQRALGGPGRRVALLGLGFKMETDDLRESPSVDLAETLLGKGFDVRIFDPIIQPSQLVGSNRHYVESRLPHLRRLLTDSPGEVLSGADVAIVTSSANCVVRAILAAPPPMVLDLCGRLGAEIEALPGYCGIGW